MKKLIGLLSAVVLALGMCSCHVSTGTQHETQVKQLNTATSMDAFDGISLATASDVVLVQGDQPSVTVKGENLEGFEMLAIYVEDGTLYIDSKRNESWWESINVDVSGLTVYVTTPTIKLIEIAGSGSITATTPIAAGNVQVAIAGSGEMEFSNFFVCDNLHVDIAGSGNIHFSQVTASLVKTSIAGTGDVTYDNLVAGNAVSDIAGAGNITLRGKVAKHSEDVAGVGDIDISGITQ